MGNYFDQFDSEESRGSAGNYFDKFDEPSGSASAEKSSTARRILGDGGISLLKGAIAVPEAAVGIADIVTGGAAGKAAERLGFRPKEAKQILDSYLTPEQQQANKAVQQADGFVDTLGAVLDNPSTIPHAVAESLPLMGAGGGIGRGIAALAPKVGPLAAGALGEGTVMAGSAAENIRQQTGDGLLTGKQTAAALGTGVAGAALGAVGAKAGKALGFGDMDTAMVSGNLGTSTRAMPSRIAGGALAEGALEEMPQSAAEQALQNYALDRELGDGVGNAAAMGLVTGGAMGSGFGAVSGRRQPGESGQPEPDLAAAPGEPPPLVVRRGSDGHDLVQPTPTSENPAPAPVPRPDPNNGPLSRAASQLPASTPLDAAVAEPQPAPQAQPELRPEQAGAQPAETGMAADDLTPYERNQLRANGVTDEQLGQMTTEQARAAMPAAGQLGVPPAPQPESTVGGAPVSTKQEPAQAQQHGVTPVRAPLEGELSPREQRALATTFRKRGAAEIARRNLPSPDRFAVEQQGSSWAVRLLPAPAAPITGEDIDGDWAKFSSDSGTLNVPRSEMPQIKAEHRGAMVNFLNARGVAHEEQTVPAASLKPTQAEFSREKVAKAKGFTGGDRSILVSSDGHVLDGHHQWLAKREAGDDVKVIRLGAPIHKLLDSIAEFPSATQDSGAQPVTIGRQPPKRGQRRSVDRDRDSVAQAVIRLGGVTTQWKQDTTGDTKGNKNIPGVGALWSDKTGTSLDDMASLLDQHGYVPAGEMNKDGGVSWLQEAIRDEVAGSPRYAPDSARQIELAEQELLNRYAEAVARAIDEREAEYARIEAEYGQDAAADARSYDEAAIARDEQLDGALEDAQPETDTLLDGEPLEQSDAARRDDQLREADGRADRTEREDPAAAFGLQQQTEAGLAEQDRQRQERERADENARRQAEQKAQADAELNDFTLTGSGRPSDVGAARGQNDLFGAQPRTQAEAKEAEPPAHAQQGAAVAGQQDNSSPEAFVVALDGSLDFGEITTEMAQAAGRQAGKIRLQQGDESWGLRHIELRHGDEIRSAGFADVPAFVSDIARNIDQVWKPAATRQLVALHKVGNNRMMFVELRPRRDEAGDFYTVRTAFTSRRGEKKGWKLLWEGRAQPSGDSGNRPPFAEPSQDAGGKATNPSGQSSDASVAQPVARQPTPPSNWRKNYIQARQYAKALGVPVEKGQKLAEVVAQIETGLARAELDELAAEAQRRMAEAAESAGVGVALSGAEIDYLTPAEKARRHELTQALTVQDSAEQARERVQSRIKARRQVSAATTLPTHWKDKLLAAAMPGDVVTVERVREQFAAQEGIFNAPQMRAEPSEADIAEQVEALKVSRQGAATERAAIPKYEQAVQEGLEAAFDLLAQGWTLNAIGSRWQAAGTGGSEYLTRGGEYMNSAKQRLAEALKDAAFLEALRRRQSAPRSKPRSLADRLGLEGQARDLPQGKRRNRPLEYTGYSGEARSVRSYYEAGDYRIATPHEGLFDVIDQEGRAVSQMAGLSGALLRVQQLMSGAPETGSGVPLFSRAAGAAGMPVDQVQAAYQQLTQGMENAPLAKVVQSTAELPFDAPEDVLGAYWRGAIYLVADNIASAQDARDVVAHEMIGHYGLAGFFGRELRPTLERIHESNPRVRMLASKWRRDNQALIGQWKAEYGMTDAQVKARSIEEALAGMAEKGERLKGWNRLAAMLQTPLRRMGATRWADALEARTDAEALLALKQAEMFVRRGMKKADPRPDIAYPLFVRARQGGLASSQTLEEAKQRAEQGAQRYRVDGGAEESLPLAEVERAIATSPELAGVKVVQSFDDLPLVARIQALRDGVRPEQLRGVYSGGSTYVVADNHDSVADAVYTAVHEEVGHRGIRGVLGSELDASMQRLYASQAATVNGRQRIAQIRRAYASVLKRLSIREKRLLIAEEMVAHLLEDGDQPTALQRVLSKMRELLRKMFPQVPWTYTDILALGRQSRAWLRRQQDGAGSSDRYSLSAMKSVEANIRRGRNALAHAVADKTSVHRAMFRSGLGWVDFAWGSTGRVKPSGKTVGAMGLSHIFEARQRKDGLSMEEVSRLLDEIIETIAQGQEVKRVEFGDILKVTLQREDTEAVLTKRLGSNAWLLTGWEMRPDAGTVGNGTRTPTHASPTPARGSMGADLSTPGTQRDTSKSGSPHGTGSTGKNDAERADVNTGTRYSLADDQESREALRKMGLAGQEAAGIIEQIRNLTLAGLKVKVSEWSTRSEEGLFDGLNGIKRAEEAVGITSADRQGYVSARMASGIADVMHGVLHYAAPEWRDGVIAGKAGTRGVLEILGDLGPDNLTPWLAWLGGKRGQLLKAQGRENNLADADIAALLVMGNGKESLFERVYRDYAKTNEAVLDLAEQAGLIDADARAKWATEYYVPFYRQQEGDEGLFSAPRTKRGLSHQTAAIRALKGGKLPTNDLLANMLAGWTKRIDAAMKNKALLEVVDNLKGSDYLADESPRYQQVLISRSQIATQIRKDRKALRLAAQMLGLKEGANTLQVLNELMKPQNEGFEKLWTRVAPTDPDIIRVQRDGKNEYYRVNDESLLRGLKFMEGSTFNDPITRIGRAFKRVLTTGVTASPDFILRNFIRDAAHAWMINKDGFSLGKDSIKGMRDALREDQDYRDLMFAGGSFQGGYIHGADPEASAQIIRRALEKKGFTRQQRDAYLGSLVDTPAKAAAMLKEGWQKYRALGDKVENANRLSTYKAALAAGKSKRQAAFEAKDLMDYSLRGNFAAAQWFTDVVPFLNARLQGLYKLGRAVKGDKTLIAKEVAMKGAYIALFSLLLAGLNDDDERYQELQDWDKDMHWHIFLGEEHFRIPKPFELGLLFGTVPERLLHALTGSQDGEDLAKAVAHGVFQTLAFNPVPQFYQPIRELQANRNFFRDMPIEDMGDEGKLPAARYDERTSALSRGLGQLTGPTVGLSPKQLDHLVMGYTGTLGGYVLSMSNLVAGAFSDAERPALTAGDIPVAKVLYQGDTVRSTQYQTEFYDMLQEADQLYRTVRSYREEGKVAQAEQLLEESRDKLRHRPALGLARKQLGGIRTKMDQVYRDTAMDGTAKRQRLNDLQRQANQIAERVTRLAGGDF